MKLFRIPIAACLFAALLTGCATMPQPNPVVTITDPGNETGPITRRGVCVGLLTTADGTRCPGADVDARTVAGWMADRRVALVLDAAATVAGVKTQILMAAYGLMPDDLLSVSFSGHGTQRPDVSGDETDGMDEGLVLFDDVWWDDDMWLFICGLPPCRLELFTDTCHAEGNWRRLGRAIHVAGPRYVQMELDLGDEVRRGEWEGQLIQNAGCREESYSYGIEGYGGTWTQTLDDKRVAGISRLEWFEAAKAEMPANQEPVFATYNASEAFINGEALR